MKKQNISFLLLASYFLILSCASSTEGSLDSARFALDNCKPEDVAACETAADEVDKVLAGDPDNISAALIKSSARATQGRVDMLSLISDLTQTTTESGIDQETQKFKFIRSALLGTMTTADLVYLREGVSTLTDIVDGGAAPQDETDPLYRDFYFQLGMLQSLEAFIRPVKLAQPEEDVAVAAITGDDAGFVRSDFLNADNNLIKGGIEEGETGWDLVEITRKNYCALKGASIGAGFETAELRALMECQLNDNFANLAGPGDGSDTGDFPGTTITKCLDFNYTRCATTDTTE